MAAIFWASAQTYDGHEMAWWEITGRTLGHFAGYALLAAAWAWALPGRLPRRLLLAAGISFLYAVSDEYHQSFVEGRTASADDVAIDSLGIATALFAIRGRYPASGASAAGRA
jgi:VanZ family protein